MEMLCIMVIVLIMLSLNDQPFAAIVIGGAAWIWWTDIMIFIGVY